MKSGHAGPPVFDRFVARRRDDQWGVYDRVIGSWPGQKPRLGVVCQRHQSRDSAEMEANRCDRWYRDRGYYWDGLSIADRDLGQWLLVGTETPKLPLGVDCGLRLDVKCEVDTGSNLSGVEQQLELAGDGSPAQIPETGPTKNPVSIPVRHETVEDRLVRSRSEGAQPDSRKQLSLIRDAHADLLDINLVLLSSPAPPAGRGIYYFIRGDGTGTDVVVASILGAAIELHAPVDSGEGTAYWAPGPLNIALEASPAIREAKSGHIGRPRLVKSELDWSAIPPGAGIYRIKLLGEDPARPPVAVYVGRSGNFKLRPRRHEKIPLDALGQQQFGGPFGVDRIELIYAVADGPDMWNSRTLDAMEEKHIGRAVKRHSLEPDVHPYVVNVTAGRNGPPSNPRAHLFFWPVQEDGPRDVV